MLGLGSLPGAFIGASAKAIFRETLKTLAAQRMGFGEKHDGLNVGQRQMAGMFGAAQQQYYGPAITTGRVTYLGHSGYYDGMANLGRTTKPTSGRVTSLFGPRNLLGMSFHNGIDIANASGTPIRAASAGKVIFSGWDGTGYGNYIQMLHSDGTITGYGHNRRLLVKAGTVVSSGRQIAEMGTTGKSTGDHLHFQTGRKGNWFDPRKIFPQLMSGAMTLGDGYAMLHEKEAVLTKPLTEKLVQGVEAFANGGGNQYNVQVIVNGDGKPEDIKRNVKQALREIEKEKGPRRVVNGNR